MTPIEFLRLTLLVTHIVGLAAIIGPFIFQLRLSRGFDFRAMLSGAIVQLVTGFGLVGMRRAADLAVIEAKIGVKLILAVLVLAAVIAAVVVKRRGDAAGRGDGASRPFFFVAGIGAIANVIVAVFWTA